MFDHLELYEPSDRWKVGLADAALSIVTAPFRRRRTTAPPTRILLLRLERIGDLLMSLGAIRAVRGLAPDATIDLVVGSWNAGIARLIGEVNAVETLDVPWLARGAAAETTPALTRRALSWRRRGYDLAINFEGDIRSHALMALVGARRRVGFPHAGGGPLLTDAVEFDGGAHIADHGVTLVERAFDLPPSSLARAESAAGTPLWHLTVPDSARAAARAMLAQLGATASTPVIAVHAPGGRAVKQWPVERFAETARALASESGAALLLTGASGDDEIVAALAHRLREGGIPVLLAQGATDLIVLAALLEQCRLLLTGDTGPMHLAAAVGTPVVAVFGPSMPWRYAPLVADHRVVRVDLPCSPCNRIRVPPLRCQGHTPDCLSGVTVDKVVAAGRTLLATTESRPTTEVR